MIFLNSSSYFRKSSLIVEELLLERRLFVFRDTRLRQLLSQSLESRRALRDYEIIAASLFEGEIHLLL